LAQKKQRSNDMGGRSVALRELVAIVAFAAVYTIVAKLGLSLDPVSGFATLVWPPTGLALAVLAIRGLRLWPGVLFGAWAVNVWSGAPVAIALIMAVGNTLEAVIGSYALRRFGGFRGTFDSLKHVISLVLGAAALSTLVSATVGVAALGLGGIVRSLPAAVQTWRAWWVGDVLGDLVLAPVILTWGRADDGRTPGGAAPRWARAAEALLLACAVGFASYAVFFGRARAPYPMESPYILFPLFVWAALRFDLRGAALTTAFASVLAVWGTAGGHGPFAGGVLSSELFALQTFMGCAALTPLLVAGASMDRARAIRTQESVVATVSHDLRGPLNALVLSGQSLGQKLPDEEAVQRHRGVLERSVERMIRLASDLVDASAIEGGSLAIERKREDARALVHEALDLLRPAAAAKKTTLVAGDVESALVGCDPHRVLQVLSNLIGNAVKFSGEGATVTVSAARAEGQVRFSVRDTGPGIGARDLPHVFERYWRTPTSAGGGTGLGLFIAKGVVEAHGGRIWVESKPGAGSTFHFTLPQWRP
jgi:signal transduction histidine kinase